MGLARMLHRLTPPNTRAALRHSRLVNRLLAAMYGGTRSAQHPASPYRIYFDGYRYLGWNFGALAHSECAEMKFVQEVLAVAGGARCAWDVGANVGLWTLFLAGMKPALEQIVCFEPDSTNLQYLRMNVDKNNLADRVEIRPIGLSSRAGEMTFFADTVTGATGSLEEDQDFTGTYYGIARQRTSIVVRTIDDEIAAGRAPPDLIKMDVEGHELDALRGGTRLFATRRPILLVEVMGDKSQVTRLLRDWDYRLIDVVHRRWVPEVQFSTAAVHSSLTERVSAIVQS